MRIFEKYYPLAFSVFVLASCLIFQDYFYPILIINFEKLLNAMLTLSSIFLSFIGVMYGVLLTIKDSSLMQFLKHYERTQDLKSYINQAFFSDWVAIFFSLLLLMLLENTAPYIEIAITVSLVIMAYMLANSYRMIRLLSKIVDTSYNETDKKFNKKIHTPSFATKTN